MYLITVRLKNDPIPLLNRVAARCAGDKEAVIEAALLVSRCIENMNGYGPFDICGVTTAFKPADANNDTDIECVLDITLFNTVSPYWKNIERAVPPELRVVYKQHHFVIDLRYGKRRFKVTYNNGSVIQCDLMSQGLIPSYLNIPDNAVDIKNEIGNTIDFTEHT